MTNFLKFKWVWVLTFISHIQLSLTQNGFTFNISNLVLFESDPYLNEAECYKYNIPHHSNSEILNIINGSIHTLTGQFCDNLNNLKEFYAKELGIKAIHESAFVSCGGLTHLDLYKNDIHFVQSKIFVNNPHLQFVSFFGNKLTEVSPHLFQTNHKLKTLNLGDNRLTTLFLQLWKPLTTLETLDLHVNYLMELDDGAIMKTFPNLKKLTFEFNFISCERQNELMKHFKKTKIDTKATQAKPIRGPYAKHNQRGCIGQEKQSEQPLHPKICPPPTSKLVSCQRYPDWVLILSIVFGFVTITINSILIYSFYKE